MWVGVPWVGFPLLGMPPYGLVYLVLPYGLVYFVPPCGLVWLGMLFNNICDAVRIGRFMMVFNNITCILLKASATLNLVLLLNNICAAVWIGRFKMVDGF